MARLIYMGTPEFAVGALEALAKQHTILQVYTQPDRPAGRGQKVVFSAVKESALKLGLPVRQPASLKDPVEVEFLKSLHPELIVVAAYGMILKKNILDVPSKGCINIHGSLLPRWRGAAPIHHALLAGDTETGITTMLMNEGLDTGDILEKKILAIRDEETVGELHDRMAALGAEMIVSTVEGWLSQTLKPISQSILEKTTPPTYASKITKDMQWLDPSQAAVLLDRRVRALNPWPGTRVTLKNSKDGLRIKKVQARPDLQSAKTHQIIEKAGQLFLTCGTGLLELQKLQWDGRSEISAPEFINGLSGRGLALPLEVIFPAS